MLTETMEYNNDTFSNSLVQPQSIIPAKHTTIDPYHNSENSPNFGLEKARLRKCSADITRFLNNEKRHTNATSVFLLVQHK